MGQPAAKQGDRVVATDVHFVSPPVSPPASVPLPFSGVISGGLSSNVKIMGMPAATVDSTADNTPSHLPPPGTAFVRPPANRGRIVVGSAIVRINGRSAARNGDVAITCNDPADLPGGTVVAAGTVMIG
jgi:uncharacterized Zn-binding protein involved in type VI secretion